MGERVRWGGRVLTPTDQRLPSRDQQWEGNGTERDEEEREKELITALMLHFIIVFPEPAGSALAAGNPNDYPDASQNSTRMK